jgi:hypothetical protein
MNLPQRPIIWTDIDLRAWAKRYHANELELLRSARKRGRMDYVAHHMACAARYRARYADALKQHRLNDVRFFDPVAFVNGGGFELREI